MADGAAARGFSKFGAEAAALRSGTVAGDEAAGRGQPDRAATTPKAAAYRFLSYYVELSSDRPEIEATAGRVLALFWHVLPDELRAGPSPGHAPTAAFAATPDKCRASDDVTQSGTSGPFEVCFCDGASASRASSATTSNRARPTPTAKPARCARSVSHPALGRSLDLSQRG